MKLPTSEKDVPSDESTDGRDDQPPPRAIPLDELVTAPRTRIRDLKPDDVDEYPQLPQKSGVVMLFRDGELLYAAKAKSIASFVAYELKIHSQGNYHHDSANRTRLALAEYIGAEAFNTGGSRTRTQRRVTAWLENCEISWVKCEKKSAKLTLQSVNAFPPPVNRIFAPYKPVQDEETEVTILGQTMTAESARDRLDILAFVVATLWFTTCGYVSVLAGIAPSWEPGIATLVAHLVFGAMLAFFLVGAGTAGFLGSLCATPRQHFIMTCVVVFLAPPLIFAAFVWF